LNKPVKFGKYYLLERINVGGMAEVFKAKSLGVEGFEKLLAIKRILPNIAEDEDFITMFIDEAKIAVQLSHANIAQIYDLGKIDDSFFIALEYVAGKDLRTIWERHRKHNLLLPIPLSCYVMIRVCEGLDYAHRKKDAAGRDLNIVHRDVSPQNILVAYEGEVKIIDFGIAKAANKASKTQAGILKGKFGYMSPEQVRGLPIDRRSDIFSAGIILYELLTGERLFMGESDFSTLEKVRNAEILPPSTYNRAIPESLEKIVLRALAKDPDDRFSSAYDMQEELQRFLILNKTNFSRKDLAAYMKRAFKTDIEREMARQAEHQAFTGEPDDFGPEESTDRGPLRSPGRTPSRKEIPAAPAPRPAPRSAAPERPRPATPRLAQPPRPKPEPEREPQTEVEAVTAAGGEDDEDDDIETVIFDTRAGLPENLPTTPGEPPAPPPRSSPPASPRRPLLAEPETVSEGETTLPEKISQRAEAPPLADLIAEAEDEAPAPRAGPSPPPVETFSTGEATLAGDLEPRRKGSKLNLIIVLLSLAAVVIVGLAVFKFLQQRGYLGGKALLHVQVMPADAEIFLDGVSLGTGSRDIPGVKPGRHVLRAQREPSHQPYEETFDVRAKEERTLNISMSFIPAEVEIQVEPPNARVTLNGKPVGDRSPVRVSDLVPGEEQTFAFEAFGYKGETRKWSFKPREKRTEKVALEELNFDLIVASEPGGAQVWLDGERKGTTELHLKKLGASVSYQLVLKHPRFPDWNTTVRYDGNPEQKILKRFGVADGAPEDKGQAPKPELKSEPKPEPKPKPKPEPKPEPRPKVDKPKPKPEPRPQGKGYLRLNASPWGYVSIDGKKLQGDKGEPLTTPLINYELPAGKHTVTVEFNGGGSESFEIDVAPDERVTKNIKKK